MSDDIQKQTQSAVVADLLAALAVRNQLIVALIRMGRDLDRIIASHNTSFATSAKMVARARSSKSKSSRALREDYLEAAQAGLDAQAAIVYPAIQWPDERDYLVGTNAP